MINTNKVITTISALTPVVAGVIKNINENRNAQLNIDNTDSKILSVSKPIIKEDDKNITINLNIFIAPNKEVMGSMEKYIY